MPTYRPFTRVANLPANSQGDRTILEEHLDRNHDTLTDVLERIGQALFSAGGVVIAGTVTNPSAALVKVEGRLGVSKDANTFLAVADQTVDLGDVGTGVKCLVVIRSEAGAFASSSFTDATTGESINHPLMTSWGRLAVLEGDDTDYPELPDDCVPVAQVTKTGAATLTLDEVITTAPTPRNSGGGGDAEWGDITGSLSAQTDLQTALDAKLAKTATVQSYAGNRTLDASNGGAYVRITAAGTVTLPDSLATGLQCVIVNATDSDTVELDAATTLTLPSGYEPEVVNRRAVTVIHVGSNVWEVHGALVETP